MSCPQTAWTVSRAISCCPRSAARGKPRWPKRMSCWSGLGGIGSPALQYLAAAGVGTLMLIDDDTVDAEQPPAPDDLAGARGGRGRYRPASRPSAPKSGWRTVYAALQVQGGREPQQLETLALIRGADLVRRLR